MRARHVAPAAVAVLLALLGPRADACGDKFVRVGRGGRFQRGYVAVHPASILVFVNSASAGAPAMRKLAPTLKAAGHKASAVETSAAFGDALKARRYDLVVAEAADLPGLQPALQAAAPRPDVIPVLRHASKDAEAAAAKEHACVITDVEKKYDVLVDIDQVLEAKK